MALTSTPGRSAAKAGEKVGQDVTGDERGDTQVQLARLFRRFFGKRAAGIGDIGQDLRRMPQELVAVIGDIEAARMTLEEFDAEIAFKFLHGLGDR